MLSDVRNYYGLARDFGQAGYFETEHSEQIVSELKLEIKALPRQGNPGIQVALVGKEPN